MIDQKITLLVLYMTVVVHKDVTNITLFVPTMTSYVPDMTRFPHISCLNRTVYGLNLEIIESFWTSFVQIFAVFGRNMTPLVLNLYPQFNQNNLLFVP